MKTQYKLKEHVTREWLMNTKWCVKDWTKEQKTFWQTTAFDKGYFWLGSSAEVQELEAEAYFLEERYVTYTCDAEYLQDSDTDRYKLVTWGDMFETMEPSVTVDINLKSCKHTQEDFDKSLIVSPLEQPQTSVKPEQHTWVKAEYELASEALKAFESGVEFYSPVHGLSLNCLNGDRLKDNYMPVESEGDVVGKWNSGELYTKVVTPWYELVSEEKPCWVFNGNCIIRIGEVEKADCADGSGEIDYRPKGLNMSINKTKYTPLTQSQVEDIVSVMSEWNK